MLKRTASLFLALAIVGSAFAQKGHVPPEEAKSCATKLVSEVKWHDSLRESLALARKEDKLVFYMHMLGKIDGDT